MHSGDAIRRAFLILLGLLLALVAVLILWNGADLYDHDDAWLPAAFTRAAGLAVVAQGVVAAFWAAVSISRALFQLRIAPRAGHAHHTDSARIVSSGGPVLPVMGLLFLVAAICPFQQALAYAERLEGMDSVNFARELVESVRTSERTELTFGVLWLVVGGLLLASPLFLPRRVWQLGWRVRGLGCAVAAGGVVLSGLGALVWFANGLAMEAASREASLAGHVGMIAGAVVTVAGSVMALVALEANNARNSERVTSACHCGETAESTSRST